MSDVQKLACFKERPHKPHVWRFLYASPVEKKHCPGVARPDSGEGDR